MRARPSLLRRLTIFYATLISSVLFTFTSAIAVVTFENLTRSDAINLASANREIAMLVARAPAHQLTATLQRTVLQTAQRAGVHAVPIPLDLTQQPEQGPPGDLSIARIFGLAPLLIPVRGSTIVVVADSRQIEATLHRFIFTLIALLVGSLCAGWFAARIVARQTIKPLLKVTAELRRFEHGDFTPRTIVSTDLTEFGELAAAYNGAARQVRDALQERRLVEEQIRQFVAEAGHELRTPLTVVAGYVDVLRRGGDEDPKVRAIAFESLRFELRRMGALVERLMILARLDRPLAVKEEIIDVHAMVGQAIDAIAVTSRVSIRFSCDGDFFVHGEAGDVYEATANLIENAIKYGEGSDVDVVLETSGRDIVVRIRDGGPGIANVHRERIFERFYRATDRTEIPGSGLGLAIAAKAAERLHGRLELQDARPGSTTFALIVPALLAPAST